jgi:F0F1-type ATP synthase gamma subunit
MSNSKQLQEDLEAIGAIKSITSVYQETASLRMNQLRSGVAATREFLEGVSAVYNHAKTAYIASISRRTPKEREKLWKTLSFVRRNSKKVNVFLSANEHLYGTLILDVWGHYLNDLYHEKADAAVVGSIGKFLLGNEQIETKSKYFELSDDKPDATQIKKVIDFISQYEEVVVYHGQMVTVLHQIPVKSEISGGISFEKRPERSAKRYLFEPSPESILGFFETEIIAALFNQTILEHQLARFAARELMNRKQLEVFAGFSLWSKEEEN